MRGKRIQHTNTVVLMVRADQTLEKDREPELRTGTTPGKHLPQHKCQKSRRTTLTCQKCTHTPLPRHGTGIWQVAKPSPGRGGGGESLRPRYGSAAGSLRWLRRAGGGTGRWHSLRHTNAQPHGRGCRSNGNKRCVRSRRASPPLLQVYSLKTSRSPPAEDSLALQRGWNEKTEADVVWGSNPASSPAFARRGSRPVSVQKEEGGSWGEDGGQR